MPAALRGAAQRRTLGLQMELNEVIAAGIKAALSVLAWAWWLRWGRN